MSYLAICFCNVCLYCYHDCCLQRDGTSTNITITITIKATKTFTIVLILNLIIISGLFSFCVFFVIILTIIALNPAIILTGTSSCQYYRFNMSKWFSEGRGVSPQVQDEGAIISRQIKWFMSNCQKALWFSSLHSFWQSDTTATQGMAEKNKADPDTSFGYDWFCSILSIFCRGYAILYYI